MLRFLLHAHLLCRHTLCNENNTADKYSYDVIFSLNFILSEISMNNIYIIYIKKNESCTLVCLVSSILYFLLFCS